MENPSREDFAYEVHHTVITVIGGVGSEEAAETLARRMLEHGPVDRSSITEGADVFRVEIEPIPAAAARKRG